MSIRYSLKAVRAEHPDLFRAFEKDDPNEIGKLSREEIQIQKSLEQIKQGKCKHFKCVEDYIKDLEKND